MTPAAETEVEKLLGAILDRVERVEWVLCGPTEGDGWPRPLGSDERGVGNDMRLIRMYVESLRKEIGGSGP